MKKLKTCHFSYDLFYRQKLKPFILIFLATIAFSGYFTIFGSGKK